MSLLRALIEEVKCSALIGAKESAAANFAWRCILTTCIHSDTAAPKSSASCEVVSRDLCLMITSGFIDKHETNSQLSLFSFSKLHIFLGKDINLIELFFLAFLTLLLTVHVN